MVKKKKKKNPHTFIAAMLNGFLYKDIVPIANEKVEYDSPA